MVWRSYCTHTTPLNEEPRYIDPILSQRCPSVFNAGPTLSQHCFSVSCLLDRLTSNRADLFRTIYVSWRSVTQRLRDHSTESAQPWGPGWPKASDVIMGTLPPCVSCLGKHRIFNQGIYWLMLDLMLGQRCRRRLSFTQHLGYFADEFCFISCSWLGI